MTKIALVGNPNSGKSSLFNVLTGLNQKVGNFPGVTVERKSGKMQLTKNQEITLIDLPGIYNLYPASEDEQIACDVIRNAQNPDHADIWIVVADATQVRRSLLLCTQMIDLQIPVILAVNMIDLIENSETRIDYHRLSTLLDIPVLPISARENKGISELKTLLKSEIPIPYKRILKLPEGFNNFIAQAQTELGTKNDYLAYQSLIAADTFSFLSAEKKQKLQSIAGISNGKSLIVNEMLVRYDRIDYILSESLKPAATNSEKWTEKLDKIFLHKIGGYLIFIGVLYLIFRSIFAWAEYPMNAIEWVFDSASTWFLHILPEHLLSKLFVHGIWEGLKNVVIFVPQIALLFFFIAILEETGYMSRVVFLMDRIMKPFGFSGKSVIPLIGGMACAVPSIMMARTIQDKKERLITILVTPLMSCSARLPVYTLLLTLLAANEDLKAMMMMGMYLLGFVMALLAAFVLKKTFHYQSNAIFVQEMPMYRAPRWKNVGITIWQKSRSFITDAGKIIVVISVILWFLASFAPNNRFESIEKEYQTKITSLSSTHISADSLQNVLSKLEYQKESEKLRASYAGIFGQAIEPAIRPLGFDWKIGISLLSSFAAREVFVPTMATIYNVSDADEDNPKPLAEKLLAEINPETGKPLYNGAVVLSLLVFYAFAMQCMSTLAVTKRETGSWKWTLIMLGYLTALAYFSSFLVYQLCK
jgi:ferrous iron transport protein B